jgi:Tfp pilus assembly protein PilF
MTKLYQQNIASTSEIMTPVIEVKQEKLTRQEMALARLSFALDCIDAGKLLKAKESIREAIENIETPRSQAVDDEILRLLQDKKVVGY